VGRSSAASAGFWYDAALMRRLALLAAVVALASCAHQTLAGGDLDKVQRPAFLSWIENGAGPRSEVFVKDESYKDRLKKLEAPEADKRLAAKLEKSVNRFEIHDRLRAGTLLRLPKEEPWTNVVEASKVASLYGSFLVEEVPAPRPDPKELKQLGVDAVVEFIIQAYGMRSAKGKAGIFVEGEARMFWLDGGDIWRMPIKVDQVAQKTAAMDPFEVAKDANRVLFRDQLNALLDQVAQQAAKELQPLRRSRPAKAAEQAPPPGELEAPKPPATDQKSPPPKKDDGLPPPGELE
jgi:hypothetical protein